MSRRRLRKRIPREPVDLADKVDYIKSRMHEKSGAALVHFKNGIFCGVQFPGAYEHADSMPDNREDQDAA